MHLLDSPVQDGGQWDMFVNLIEKYGLYLNQLWLKVFRVVNQE